jgi:hypothetical protein
VNWIASVALTGTSAGFGGLLTGAVVAKSAALVGAAVAAPFAAGAVAVGALGAWGMRAAYQAGLRKGREELVGILKMISVTCRLGTGFFPAAPAPAASTDQGDGLDLSGLL